MNRQGSTILLLVFIFSFVSLFYLNGWYSSLLLSDYKVNKYLYEKKLKLAQGLYYYGLAICINSFDYLIKNKNGVVLFDDKWPTGEKDYHGHLSCLSSAVNQIEIQATIKNIKNNDNITIKSELLAQDIAKHQKKYFIKSWKINEQ